MDSEQQTADRIKDSRIFFFQLQLDTERSIWSSRGVKLSITNFVHFLIHISIASIVVVSSRVHLHREHHLKESEWWSAEQYILAIMVVDLGVIKWSIHRSSIENLLQLDNWLKTDIIIMKLWKKKARI